MEDDERDNEEENNDVDKEFGEQESIRMHSLRPYKCPLCAKSFSTSGTMERHKRIQTGEKPFTCPLCPKSFSQSGNMESHKRIHTGEKPFKCPLCAKSFSESGNMERHKRIHIGERPYKCPLCPKSFSQSPLTGSHHQDRAGNGESCVPQDTFRVVERGQGSTCGEDDSGCFQDNEERHLQCHVDGEKPQGQVCHRGVCCSGSREEVPDPRAEEDRLGSSILLPSVPGSETNQYEKCPGR